MEFKNSLDSLVEDVEADDSPKRFANIDMCFCWGKVGDVFKGYELGQISDTNPDERKYPGVTQLLRRDGDAHVVGVVMLETITSMIRAGKLSIPVKAHS